MLSKNRLKTLNTFNKKLKACDLHHPFSIFYSLLAGLLMLANLCLQGSLYFRSKSCAMATKQSAGILVHRKKDSCFEVFLVHPGGPFWKNKDEGAWSIPKGEFTDDEDALDAAKREFLEETGFPVSGNFVKLKPVKLKSGKKIFAWAIESDVDTMNVKSNFFEMEWPPKSGKLREFPEVDRAEWFEIERALQKINLGQASLIKELVEILKGR